MSLDQTCGVRRARAELYRVNSHGPVTGNAGDIRQACLQGLKVEGRSSQLMLPSRMIRRDGYTWIGHDDHMVDRGRSLQSVLKERRYSILGQRQDTDPPSVPSLQPRQRISVTT